MPEKPTLPTPNQVFNKTSLPSPNDVFNQPTGLDKGFNPNELIQNQDKFNEVLNNIEDVSEDEKNIIKKLALAAHDGDKGVTSADVSDAILTLQGRNQEQGGGKYYIKEVAHEVYKPISLKAGEKPPKGYDVASIWGTQSSANDDTAVTSLGKHLWNGLFTAGEGYVNLSDLAYGAITGEESPWYQSLKNSIERFKFETPDYEKGEIFNTEGINSASDFFDPSRYDFSKDKVQGQVFRGLESLVSFLFARGVAGKVTKATSKIGKIGESFVGSYAVNYGESLQAAEDAGLTGRDKYAYAGITTVPTAALDVAFGTEGLFVKNTLARDGKKKMLESLAKGFKEDIGGKLTKESLEDLYKTTTAAATNLNKSFTRQLGENILEEAGTESAQALVQNGAQMVYDQLSKDPKFGKDAFSLESIGEYLNNAIGGAFGAAGPGVYGVSQERKASKEELQSSNAYEAVKKGLGEVEKVRANIYSSYKSGDLSKEEMTKAMVKINAYYDFNQQLGETKLPDEQRKQVMDLAFQKELLYNQIKDTEKEKLGPIEMAKYEAKAKMAKDIQAQINEIVLKPEAEKEVTVGNKTMEDIAKKEEKEAESGTTKTEKKVKVDERKFDAIPPIDWNTKKASEKFKILTRDLQESNEPVQGSLTLESGGPGRTTSDTVHVNLPGNKFVITASSAKSLATQLRGHFKTEFVEGDIENLPVVVKPMQLTSGKTVLGIYNEGNGKFISYVREDDKGGSKYSKAEEEQLQHIQATGKLSKGEIEYYKNKRQPPPAGEAGTMEIKTPVTPVMPQGGLKPISDVTTTRQTTGEGITVGKTEPVTGDVSETSEQDVKNVKEIKIRTGTKRNQTSVKHPERKKALAHEVTDPYHVVLQYFSGKGTISSAAIGELYGTKGDSNTKDETKAFQEKWARKSYTTSKERTLKGTETLDALAHKLWEGNRANTPDATTSEYREAIETAIGKHLMPREFAKELNDILIPKEQRQTFENEEAYNAYYDKLEELGLSEEGNKVADNLEKLDDKELEHLANMPEKEFDVFGNEIVDIIIRKDLEGDVFQKDKLKTIENEAESIIKGGSVFNRLSQEEERGRVVGGRTNVEASIVLTGVQRTGEGFERGGENVQQLKENEALTKIVEKLKKSMPKVKVVYDDNLTAAGKWSPSTNTVTINPFYAGLDTPIHEYGHVLIEAIGYNNKVIQSAIKQLKSTPLWKETSERYPELDEKNLGIEVLAEAIGLEGAGIFEKEADKSKFRQYLEYIFDWLKTKLGLNKNIAKSLAKQIVAGIGTKKMQGEKQGKAVSLQLPSGERINGVEVMPEVVNGFYSKLEKQLLQMKLDKAPAKQWNDKLRSEEAKWTGLNDWLAEKGQTAVTRQEIKDFLKNNKISLVEVVKGGGFNFDEAFKIEDRGDEIEVVYADRDMSEQNPYSAYLNDEGFWGAYDFWNENSIGEFNTKEEAISAIREDAEKTKSKEVLTRYHQYQLDGDKENYRELLITMPAKAMTIEEYKQESMRGGVMFGSEQRLRESYNEYLKDTGKDVSKSQNYRSSHWEEPNILVHLRMNERTDAEGNKVLFLEEVQSDWGQQGKKEGFKEAPITELPKGLRVISNKQGSEWAVFDNNNNDYGYGKTKEEAINNAIKELNSRNDEKNIEQAPFVTDTNAWVKLGLKYALKQAVESGATKIAWTTGEQQNDRYDLSKQADSIDVSKDDTGMYKILAKKSGETTATKFAETPQEIEAFIGKDMAEKIVSANIPNGGAKVFSGVDLKIGGKGMKGFYDKILPDVFKALVKELTGKSGEISYVDVSGNEFEIREGPSNQQSITITPELAKSVGAGIPMFQKPKSMENKSDKELEYSTIGSFDVYRSKALNRNLSAIKKSIKNAQAKLEDEETTTEEAKGIQEILDYHANLEAQDKKAYMDYRNDMSEIKGLTEEKEIHKYSEEELFKIYNNIINFQKFAKGTLLPDVMKKIGMALFDKQSNALKNDPKTKEMFDEDLSKIKDLTPTEVRMKVLSHMSQNFPELQALNKLYDSAVFAKEKEAKEKKRTLEKLGKKVIEEKNKQLGIAATVGSAFSSDSAKYFEYLDNGQGEYLTVNQAKKKGLSDAQIEFLKYMRELVAEREGLASIGADVDNMIMEVVKIDPGFKETYKQSGLAAAYSHLLGDTYNISNVRIPYTDPNTGKEGVTEFKNIENILIAYGKQGLPQMLKALALLTKYNWRARKQLKVGKNYDQSGEDNELKIIKGGEYTLDGNGNLIGKFDRKRNKDRGYSKDFYKAAMSYIEDTAHVKHMTPLMPAISSIQYLNENGVFGEKGEELHGKKPNVVKWLEDWRDMHIFKKEKETIPELDLVLKTLRFMTSATTMWFNLPAGAMNLFIGLYNNWRAQTEPILRKGNARLFLKGTRKAGYGMGALNPYAVDLIRKYNVVSTDIDSNPKIFAGRIFDTIANGATRFGEFIVQGSGVLGLMDEDLYNSFEYKKDKHHGVEQLVVKEGLDEKEIEKKILALRNRISDIQGKYADKDKRNFMNNELGKAVMQFKVWIPDFFIERFGQPYINADGEYRQGSMRPLIKDGFKDLRAEFKKQGKSALMANTPDAIAFRQNLKGLMAITLLSILANSGDDDEEKSLAVKMASKGLSDVLFIFNPTDQGTLKFTLSKPIAGMSVVDRFIDTADHLLAFEEDDYYKRTGAPKIGNDILNIMPGKKLIKPAVDLMFDEE